MITVKNFSEAKHLQRFQDKASEVNLLLAWETKKQGERLVICNWQEPHSCRERVWVAVASFQDNKLVLRNLPTGFGYNLQAAIDEVQEILQGE
jgi:hypothetical protein